MLDTASSVCLLCLSAASSDRDRIFFSDCGEFIPANQVPDQQQPQFHITPLQSVYPCHPKIRVFKKTRTDILNKKKKKKKHTMEIMHLCLDFIRIVGILVVVT